MTSDVQIPSAMPLYTDDDVVRVRAQVRQFAVEIGLSLVDQTKVVTAASELARNTLRHAGGGEARLQILQRENMRGLHLAFSDRGPGIADIGLAMTDGYTSGGGLGLGLGGAKRLVDEFELTTEVGKGTTVVIIKWKRF
ncbi:MAG: putative anti-sigma factor [Verrucomicrobiaceae bacterium]|nr:putative anti-sigma factor [Verrucomicrobiaceae bacterium]